MKLRTPNRIIFVTAIIRDSNGKAIYRQILPVKDYTGKG